VPLAQQAPDPGLADRTDRLLPSILTGLARLGCAPCRAIPLLRAAGVPCGVGQGRRRRLPREPGTPERMVRDDGEACRSPASQLAAGLGRQLAGTGHAGHWPNWRRPHQARSRRVDQRPRLVRDTENCPPSLRARQRGSKGVENPARPLPGPGSKTEIIAHAPAGTRPVISRHAG